MGALLVDTFSGILFDDPVINQKDLTARQQDIYQQCRNPRYWHTPDSLTPQQANTHRQRLGRNKDRFRALLNQYGSSWQGEVSALVRQTWEQLTAVDDDLLTRIDNYKTTWQNRTKPDISDGVIGGKYSEETVKNQGETCHKLTTISPPNCHELTALPNADLSRINPLYSGVHCDTGKSDQLPTPGESTGTPERPGESTPGGVVCPVTGETIDQPQPAQRFVSAAMLRNNDDLLLTLDRQHRQYAKGSKEDLYSRAAHNVRNKDSNPRNNLRRSINRIYRHPVLFDVSQTLKLTSDQRTALDHWKGTQFKLPI